MDIEQSNIAEEKFKDKIFQSMKENLMFSLISFLWNFILTNASVEGSERDIVEKDFITHWKSNMSKITQEQIEEINNILNEQNIDMINIITGSKQIADVEDYQDIITNSIKEIESIFWKICGKVK